ncbi:polyadenylate-binding protein 2 isoform X2 [Brienomyrus brachyistius]|uniref:polyadenylate-binding protein 2 isoform X2 n=1 Tax=Brienomyrus brachyistius TaxID=42636 RepID=UPI0020B41E74|nr:polyadenylate-binding protein 2 isoform X2 [Brienomyrus brachyistius]
MFSPKRKLSVHLCRMRTGSSENHGEDDPDTPSTSCPKLNQSSGYMLSKPYQCAVCCVSYSCSISLKSHLRSVLHQTRSRNAECPSSCTTENVRTTKANTSSTNCAINSATSMSTSPSTMLSLHNSSTSTSTIPLPWVSSQQEFLSLSASSLQTQNQNLNPDAPGQVLTPSLSSAQVLLAEKTHDLQNLGLSVEFSTAQSTSSEEKMVEKAQDIAEGVDERVNKKGSDRVHLEPENANLSPKDTLYAGQKIKEGCTGSKGIGIRSPLKYTKKGAVQDVEENGMAGENTTDKKNYGVQMQFKRCQNSERKIAVPCEVVPQSPLAFQATHDTILPQSAPLPCSTSPSSNTQLGTTNLQFSLRPSSTRQNSHADISAKHCLTESLEYTPDGSDVKTHFTLPGTDSKPSEVALQGYSGVDLKSSQTKPMTLSDFQSQVLRAFLESQSQADVADPSQQNCEELAREVGLGVEEIHKWFGDVQKTKAQQNSRGGKDGIHPVTMVVDHRKDIRKRNHGKNVNREIGGQGNFCQTSESNREEFYTAAIVTDEESQSRLEQDEQSTLAKVGNHDEEGVTGEGKVLLSDELSVTVRKRKWRNSMIVEQELVNIKKEKLNPDVNLELGTLSDSPAPPVSFEQGSLSRITTGASFPFSIAPVITSFSSPLLSLPPSVVGLGISKGTKPDQGKRPILPRPLATHPFCDPLKIPLLTRHTPPCQTLYGKDDNESALDLSVGKNCSPVSASSTSTSANKIPEQNQLFKGLGLNAVTKKGAPETSDLIVVHVKPKCTFAASTSLNGSINKMNKGIKAAEPINNGKRKKETKGGQQEERKYTSRDIQLLRGRSRTIIQPEQLDVLYGCYFKEPNPAKHEFERISEWVKLPKRVVQIWFQNMRARERKGEVRFLGSGTLAAVGKPLIKFTWPLSSPVLSKGTNPNTGDRKLRRVTADVSLVDACIKTPLTKNVARETKSFANAKLMTCCSSDVRSLTVSKTGTQLSSPKAKSFTQASNFSVPFAIIETYPPRSPQKCKRDKDDELHDKVKENDNEEDEPESHISVPGSTSQMAPKVPLTPVGKHSDSQKQSGLNYWTTKAVLSMNTPNEQMVFPSHNCLSRISMSSPPGFLSNPGTQCNSNLQQCIPRRPRTLLTNLQLSILQSCYEICPHPNAAECEVMGSELKLPQRVIQIWFQNTRAKEKRWYLQQEKQLNDTKDLSARVNFGSSGYLEYRALRANRPILPKPVQFTLLVSSEPSDVGYSSHEALKGRCEELEAIKARVREMEEEAEKLKELQNEVEKQMNLSPPPGPVIMSLEEKMEADGRSIYVGNVDYGATAEELEAHFHGCGSVNRVTILCDKFTGHPKGFAYIEFADKESVRTAMALDESLFRGRQIKVGAKRTNRPGISTTDRGFPRARFRSRGGNFSSRARYYSGYTPPRGRGRAFRFQDQWRLTTPPPVAAAPPTVSAASLSLSAPAMHTHPILSVWGGGQGDHRPAAGGIYYNSKR